MSNQASLGDISNSETSEDEKEVKESRKPTAWRKIAEDWKEAKTETVSSLITDGSHNPPSRVDNGVPILSSQNVRDGEIDFSIAPSYISEEDFEKMDRNLQLQKNDLLLTIVGTLGRSALVREKKDFAIQRSIAVIRPNEEVNPRFLKCVTDSYEFLRHMEMRSRATAQKGLYLEALRKISVPLPEKDEQRRIASVLYNVDQAISKTEEIIESMEKVEKGVQEEILLRGLEDEEIRPEQSDSPEIYQETRIGEIPESWKILQIRDIVPEDRPVTYGIVQPGDYVEDGVPLIRGQNYIGGWEPLSEFFRVDPELHEKYDRCITKTNDVLICIAGANTGAVNIVPEWIDEANLTQTTARIAVNESVAEPEFIRLVLESPLVQSQVKSWTKGSAQSGLNLGRVEKFKVPIPPLSEQREIISKMNSFSKKISNEKEYLEQLQRLKKGLMQDLLTGSVRTDEDVEVLDEVTEVES